MKKLLVISLLVVLGMLVMRCTEESNAEEAANTTEKIMPVQTLRLKPQSFSSYLQITGTVKARNHINMVAEEGGTLKRIVIDKGHHAAAGDTLAILENRVLEAGYHQAQAALQQAQLDFRSKEVLYRKKAISENEYLSSKYAMNAANSAFELATARYSKLFIIAPMNGLVNNRFYDLGAYVTPMTPIFEFIDNNYLKVTAGVAERFISDIHLGTPVEVRFDAYPNLVINSQISFISRSIDPRNRTFEIEVVFPNRENKLAPQMIANLKILREKMENRVVVPLDALIESEQGWYVYIVEDNHAKKTPVQQKAIYDNKVLVDGLQAGQELVVVGQQDLSDGDLLKIVPDIAGSSLN